METLVLIFKELLLILGILLVIVFIGDILLIPYKFYKKIKTKKQIKKELDELLKTINDNMKKEEKTTKKPRNTKKNEEK